MKRVILSDLDREMLLALYKHAFLLESHLAILIGENAGYVKSRLKQLCAAGLIGRKVIHGFAANFITSNGIRAAGLDPRKIKTPHINNAYEHSLGVADVCTWFSLWRTDGDGHKYQFVHLGSIVTERDFNSVRDMQLVGHRSDGHPVYKPADKDIHAPDAYFRRRDGTYAAIEYERTRKSASTVVDKNIHVNMERFSYQYWVYDDPYTGKILKALQSKIGKDRMAVYDIRVLRKNLDDYLKALPSVITRKSGEPRLSCMGRIADPVPLNHLPILPQYQKHTMFETRETAIVPISGDHSIPSSSVDAVLIKPVSVPGPAPASSFDVRMPFVQTKSPAGKVLFERR